MTQRDLFDGSWNQPSPLPATTANAQAAQLKRVGGAIGDLVWAWCLMVYRDGGTREFHMGQLLDGIAPHARALGIKIAPDSPSRILRLLRQEGRVEYEVINRAQSLYRVVSVEEEQA